MKILITGGSGFIGTNAIQYFLGQGMEVLNLDIHPPANPQQAPYWRKADLLAPDELLNAFGDFQPDVVIHMAARTDCDENTTVEAGYAMNTQGTQNVLDAIRQTPSVKRAIIVSSQFVCGAPFPPGSDLDFHPVTVYGQSKVVTEQLTRAADLECCWTLVRPTNIWGPWHQRYAREFWKIAAKGLYVHPGGGAVTRCYGYVGNLVEYLASILKAPEEVVRGQVFYLSDPPADIYHWANAFCMGLTGKPARRIPRPILKGLGLVGDVITRMTGKIFYITSGRVNSMTSDYLVPGAVERTIKVLGPPRYSLEEGVAETVKWIKSTKVSLSGPHDG